MTMFCQLQPKFECRMMFCQCYLNVSFVWVYSNDVWQNLAWISIEYFEFMRIASTNLLCSLSICRRILREFYEFFRIMILWSLQLKEVRSIYTVWRFLHTVGSFWAWTPLGPECSFFGFSLWPFYLD